MFHETERNSSRMAHRGHAQHAYHYIQSNHSYSLKKKKRKHHLCLPHQVSHGDVRIVMIGNAKVMPSRSQYPSPKPLHVLASPPPPAPLSRNKNLPYHTSNPLPHLMTSPSQPQTPFSSPPQVVPAVRVAGHETPTPLSPLLVRTCIAISHRASPPIVI